MKALILGGNGFLGTHLCISLLEAGHEVRIFDKAQSTPCLPITLDAEYVFGDFSDSVIVEKAITGCDIIFHLISSSLPLNSNDNPISDLECNLVRTVKLMEMANRQGVKKILFSSSGGTIYGAPQELPIKETHPTEPTCSYGIGKLAIEKYLQLFEQLYGLSYCVLRIANPYGEGQHPLRPQGAIAVFSHKALIAEDINIWGDGSAVRDYIHVSDVTSAFLKALTYEGNQRIFNIGSGCGYSVNDILDTIELLVDRMIKRKYLVARDFDVPANILDISRARQHLDWEPKVTLTDGLNRTLFWLNNIKNFN